MNKHMKKLVMMFVLMIAVFTLVACGEDEPTNSAPIINGTSDLTVEVGGTLDALTGVTAIDVEDGDITANLVVDDSAVDLTTEGDYTLTYSITDSAGETVTASVTVTVTPPAELTDEDRVAQDIEAFRAALAEMEYTYELDLPLRGGVHRSVVTWKSNSPYMSADGVLLPLPQGVDSVTAEFTGTFVYRDARASETFSVTLNPMEETVIATSRMVPFSNTTTEYDIADGELELFYEDGGYVPYVRVTDFLALLEGFVDPELELTVTETENTLVLFYQYYSEIEDETYDLELTIDATENTITTNDPGFYWAYIYSTETNYGRHIEYDLDNPDAHYVEGTDVVYDLDDFNLDMAIYEGDIVLPYYIVNQLFAGSSYYNVYYNNEELIGIYATPADDSDEYRDMKTSDMNGEAFPVDLVIHNFNMLAFNLEYFYGLKDLLGIDSFYELLYTVSDDLLAKDPEVFDLALRELLLKKIDEPHTSYNYPGYFNDPDFEVLQNSLSYYGTRFTNWYYDGYLDVDTAIGDKWGESTDGSWNAYSGKRPDYWFLDDTNETVVITLNGFVTSDIEESATFDGMIVDDMLKKAEGTNVLPTIAAGTKFFYYNNSSDTERLVELLIKTTDATSEATYKTALENDGWTFVFEESVNQSKQNGYYTKTVDGTAYMVQVAYDTTYSLLYVGIMDEQPATYGGEWPFVVEIKDLIDADSAVYLEMTFDLIDAEAPNLQNAMLDLTWNTGGNVGALYRVVGFVTTEPFMTASIDGDTGGESSSYVYIDGVPSREDLNWALITSPLTFSAANSLTAIFEMNDLGTIIGLQTGGGASSITPILLPNGTAFTMSSNNVGAMRTGSGTEEDPFVYTNTEYGVTPDIIIDIEDIYNEAVLITAFE